MGSLNQDDVALWSSEQASALRKAASVGSNRPIDWENVAEEIESVGNSERLRLRSQISRVLEDLMKLAASPAREPRRGWIETVIDAQREIEDVLQTSPSLRREVTALVEEHTPRMRKVVGAKLALYGDQPTVELDTLRYSVEQVLGWRPEV